MSTAFERRAGATGQRRDRDTPRAPVVLQRPTAPRHRAQAPDRAVAARLRQRLNRARFVAATIIALSILGLAYLTQISHVARYGYFLSDLQRQQARVERENQLLEYQLTRVQNLGQAGDLAGRTYGMVPLVKYAPTATAGPTTGQASAGAKGTPQARYITVERPATAPPAPAPQPARIGLIDRVGRHLIGVGVAVAER